MLSKLVEVMEIAEVMGFAVALDNGSGLIVPVVANADEKNVTGLQRSIVDLAVHALGKVTNIGQANVD